MGVDGNLDRVERSSGNGSAVAAEREDFTCCPTVQENETTNQVQGRLASSAGVISWWSRREGVAREQCAVFLRISSRRGFCNFGVQIRKCAFNGAVVDEISPVGSDVKRAIKTQ